MLKALFSGLLILGAIVAGAAAYAQVAEYVYERSCLGGPTVRIVDREAFDLLEHRHAEARRTNDLSGLLQLNYDVKSRETRIVPYVFRQQWTYSTGGRTVYYLTFTYLDYPKLDMSGYARPERDCLSEHPAMVPFSARF